MNREVGEQPIGRIDTADISGRAGAMVPDVGVETATEYRTATYLPGPERTGVALCLSGGGFRAALFHLGALRRLNELGILSKVDTISAVSGGSIIAAHLAERIHVWPPAGTVLSDWEERVAMPFRVFTARNLRTGPLTRRLLPWNWLNETVAVKALEAGYKRQLTRLTLGALPDRPRFVFSATDMVFGVNWIFEKNRIGDYQAGYHYTVADYPVARAVAASSCFPPVFDPLHVGLKPDQLSGGAAARNPRYNALIASLRVTDGGAYDNMGLEPVWKMHAVVLVSDGGATFDLEADRNFILRLNRYIAIVGRQAGAIRKRWLIASFIKGVLDGAYWGIGSATQHYDDKAPGYPKQLVEDIISEVRTDLDAFSDAEIAVLENHGYLLADAALQKHARALLPPNTVPLAIPHPQWMDQQRVAQALAESHKVRLLGRWRWHAPKRRL
jgi:NTE family protein